MGKRIPTVNYSLTTEIGTYTAIGLALVEFKFMTTSVLAGAKNEQVITIFSSWIVSSGRYGTNYFIHFWYYNNFS